MITIRRLLQQFPDEGERLLLCAFDKNETMVGSVALNISSRNVGPKAGVFTALFVRCTHRREGVGRTLMHEAEEAAAAQGCHFITAYVKPGYRYGFAWDDGDLAIAKELKPLIKNEEQPAA